MSVARRFRLHEARGIVPAPRGTGSGYCLYPADTWGLLAFVGVKRGEAGSKLYGADTLMVTYQLEQALRDVGESLPVVSRLPHPC